MFTRGGGWLAGNGCKYEIQSPSGDLKYTQLQWGLEYNISSFVDIDIGCMLLTLQIVINVFEKKQGLLLTEIG